MRKERMGSRGNSVPHVSEEEKKRNMIIYVLVGLLIAIFLIIIIIMIPKGGKKEETVTSNSGPKTIIEDTNTTTNEDENDTVKRNKNKVSITMDPETITEDGGIITITDSNSNPYKWSSLYEIEEFVDGEWVKMELLNPDNYYSALSNNETENPTGVMSQSLVWSNKYGKLEVGKKYRIVKESEGIEFYAEFEVR